jgi:hypothetical protein
LGELIAFKPGRIGTRVKEALAGHATIVIFTGIRQERPIDEQASPTKRLRKASGKRSKKSDSTLDGPRK